MIVLDIETSGKYTIRYGIWQIGAVDMETEEEFLEESRIDDDEVSEEALRVTGKTERELRDKKKLSQKEMIKHFIAWVKNKNERLIAGHNIWWDVMFLQNKCIEYELIDELDEAIGHRVIDTHSLAQFIYKKKNGKFKTENGKSSMNLSIILEMCGMKDERIQLKKGELVKEGKPHNALEDAKLTAECFSRLVYGKNLFSEYSKFSIPEVLRK